MLSVRGARKGEHWGLLLINGLFGIAIGLAAALLPGLTLLVLVLMIAAWALVSGGLMLGAAFTLKVSHGRWLLVFGAIASLLYGLLLFLSPFFGALALTWWMGAHALVSGVALLVLAFRLRKHRGEHAFNAAAASGLNLGRR